MHLELQEVTKSFRLEGEDLPILRGISLNIQEGEFVALMGPSGSGKTTLMNILGLLDRPNSGEYRMDQREVGQLSVEQRARLRSRALGYVFQNFNLIPRETALANVETPLMYQGLASRERYRRAMEALERVGMNNRAKHLPSQLSGGQQQRVAIARALAGGAKILLADEPTGALDTRTGLQIMALFEALNRENHTLIMVTHDPDIAQHARRIVHMRDGRIRSEEAVTQPLQAERLLAEMPQET
ncbi:MAG: ABC transporter ATP-binding protein [Thermaceae bacterium]|nr:ABC transporter ATP-binding protein [Thermaceae bacterium]